MSGAGGGRAASKVLDAWAVVAWLRDQAPASHKFEQRLEAARKGAERLLLNIVNLGEALYITAKAQGPARAELVLEGLQRLPIEIRAAPNTLVLEAARLKGQYPISYADAFAVATAIRNSATLVTGDPELKRFIGSGIVEVEWIGR